MLVTKGIEKMNKFKNYQAWELELRGYNCMPLAHIGHSVLLP